MEEHRLALVPGYQFDQFRIEATLGKGGFGITYRALDLHLNKRVALKELLPDSIATRIDGSTVVPHSASLEESWQWARERFLEEAKILAGFSHPAIVGVHRLIEANGTVYMVMDYVEGETYEAQLRRTGPVCDQATLLAVFGPLLSGLAEVHRQGLIHRDIKPENILINRHGSPILIDFGSARSAVGATMTMTSIVTHGYSPFEQYQTQGRMGPWTDIYALGAVACRAITGEKPQVAADRIEEEKFVWVSHRGLTGFSEECLAAIDWALRVRVNERPQRIEDWELFFRTEGQDAVQMPPPIPYEDFHAPVSQPPPRETIVTDPIQAPPPKSNKALLVVVTLVVVFGLILGAVIFHQGEKERAAQIKALQAIQAKALQSIREVVKSGNTVAQWRFVMENAEQIKKFAESGESVAQFLLGKMYDLGWSVSMDNVTAAQWYRKAATQGNANAQFSLGVIYTNGSGVAKDEAEAVRWWRKAAEQGNTDAIKELKRRGLR